MENPKKSTPKDNNGNQKKKKKNRANKLIQQNFMVEDQYTKIRHISTHY